MACGLWTKWMTCPLNIYLTCSCPGQQQLPIEGKANNFLRVLAVVERHDRLQKQFANSCIWLRMAFSPLGVLALPGALSVISAYCQSACGKVMAGSEVNSGRRCCKHIVSPWLHQWCLSVQTGNHKPFFSGFQLEVGQAIYDESLLLVSPANSSLKVVHDLLDLVYPNPATSVLIPCELGHSCGRRPPRTGCWWAWEGFDCFEKLKGRDCVLILP